ncbi:MAG: nucleotide exchange factor GrpE [Bacteroidales bacterium]|nr:nucleotide exchange factor GrpE [Bacteroidales bacterium]
MSKKKTKKDKDIQNEQAQAVVDQEVTQETEQTTEEKPLEVEIEPEDAQAKKIEELENTIKELNDKHLRLYSEFDNFRKRTLKEKMELSKTASAKIITELLSVWDDFERAQQHMDDSQDLDSFKEGINLIASKFHNTLKLQGLEEIESTSKTFDVDEHEAITNIPAPTEDLKGKVVDTVQKGYKLNGKIIRYAKVVVGS